ncbi:MAG: hypothetical protein SGI88_09125, partial [Candidatus Hydrogenedentes bacterium]|nr:hypothetical protein [Candidatus Hydrogenedentota bacterium]
MLSKLLTTKEQALLAGCAAAICVGGVSYYFAAGTPAAATVSPVAVKQIIVPAPNPEIPAEPLATPAI